MVTKRLPEFVIIGAQKAGTTWLGARLLEQPGIFLPKPLEVHFFDRDDHYEKGLDWYGQFFARASEPDLVGEKTPDYFWTRRPNGYGPNDIPERIHAALPDASLVLVLRDPVKRAVSALNHYVRSGWSSPFSNPDEILNQSLDPEKDRYGLIDRGHYITHLQRFLKLYPREKLHVVFFEEDIVKAPDETVARVMKFLGRQAAPVKPSHMWPENQRMNSRLGLIMNYYAPRLSPLISAFDRMLPVGKALGPSESCRARLYEHFAPYNRQLFSFLGCSPRWNTN